MAIRELVVDSSVGRRARGVLIGVVALALVLALVPPAGAVPGSDLGERTLDGLTSSDGLLPSESSSPSDEAEEDTGPATATAAADEGAPEPEFTYITMSDGVELAAAIAYPEGFSHEDRDEWPTIYVHDFYDGGGRIVDPAAYGHNYVTVHTSVRGTGCSSGRFDLFDYRGHGLDGHDVIEDWIVEQPWSNGKVGIVGHSGPGLVGFLVAATNPPSLEATAVSGLIDDLYRGLVYMGGVPNTGFPLLWTVIFRPFVREHPDNADRYTSETTSGDSRCLENIASRPAPVLLDDPVLQGLSSTEYDGWWASRALIERIDGIRAPIHITQQYQDEQTGPRGGPNLFENLAEDVPKRLVLTNGDHGSNRVSRGADGDRVAWLDCWILHDGECWEQPPRGEGRGQGAQGVPADIIDPERRVRIHFETTDSSDPNPPWVSSDFPLPETQWTRLHLRGDGSLSPEPPDADEGSSTYVSVPTARQSYQYFTDGNLDDAVIGPVASSDGPDELSFDVEFTQDTTLAGPITATLHASSTSLETDLFVQLIDVDPDGNRSYLQRGMLRTSHREVDERRSDRIADGPLAGSIYRPHRPHTDPTMITPGETYELLLEIFPVGHVFREGHRLEIKIHDTPVSDSFYNYIPAALNLGVGRPVFTQPGLNTIVHDAEHPSHLLLPLLPDRPEIPDEAPGCGEQEGVRCVSPAHRE